jgi:hypothetical protein
MRLGMGPLGVALAAEVAITDEAGLVMQICRNRSGGPHMRAAGRGKFLPLSFASTKKVLFAAPGLNRYKLDRAV